MISPCHDTVVCEACMRINKAAGYPVANSRTLTCVARVVWLSSTYTHESQVRSHRLELKVLLSRGCKALLGVAWWATGHETHPYSSHKTATQAHGLDAIVRVLTIP